MARNEEKNTGIHSLKLNKSGVRAFRKEDVPEIVRLLNTFFPRSASATTEVKQEILSELLLNNPWNDERFPSLVYENKKGRVTGFLGVTPRPMKIKDKPITAAISYNYMVDPESRSALASFNLLKAFLSGPQELSFADSANDTSRRLWERVGGSAIPLYSMYWKLPLRPAGFVAHHVEKRMSYKTPFKAITPVCRVTDRIINQFWNSSSIRDDSGKYVSQELTGEMLMQYIRQRSEGKAVVPVYTAKNLNWLLGMAAKPKRFGELKKEVIINTGNGRMAGWFIYYKNPGGVSEVLQIQAVPGKEKQVLTLLLKKAWQQEAVGVAGRLDPEWVTTLPGIAFCLYQPGRVWTIAHSDNQELINSLKGGDAFFTRLEGDMWLI